MSKRISLPFRRPTLPIPVTPKPCPFCANPKDIRLESKQQSVNHILVYFYVCYNCGAEGPFDLGKSGALKQWNMRRKEFPGEVV